VPLGRRALDEILMSQGDVTGRCVVTPLAVILMRDVDG